MPRATPEQVKMKQELAETLKDPLHGIFDECWRYAAPGMNPYEQGAGRGMPIQGDMFATGDQYRYLFDGTLARSSRKMANMFVSEMFPVGMEWAHFREGPLWGIAAPQGPPDSTKTRGMLEGMAKTMFQVVDASNFHLAMGVTAMDGVVPGTGIIKVGGASNPTSLIEFDACSLGEVALEPGPRHHIWGYHRKLYLDVPMIESLFPGANTRNLDREKDEKPAYYTVLDSTYLDPGTGVWYNDVVIDGGPDGLEPVYKDEYPVCPWAAWRYFLLPGHTYGYSPVMAALPDARTVDKAILTRLKSASLRVAGMFVATRASGLNAGTVQFEDGAIIQVESNPNGDPAIAPLQVGGDVQLGEIILADHRQGIKDTMMDMALPPPGQNDMTAREIVERLSEAQKVLGSPFLRMAQEIGQPVLRALAWQLQRGGILKGLEEIQPVPEEGGPVPLQFNGLDVQILFASPLAQGQSLANASTAFQWASAVLDAFGPEAVDGMKVEDAAQITGELMNVDARLIRSMQERAARVEARQQALQQQAAPAPAGGQPNVGI